MAKRHANRVSDLESMFLRLEELVLANSGEDEFEEIYKLLIAKLYDERCGAVAFHTAGTEIEIRERINALLRQASRVWPNILITTQSALTPEHLAVCVDALQRHTLSAEGLEVLDSFFEFLVSKTAKGAKGQYFTPRYVIELCVRMLRPQVHESVLDPACGSGGFLLHTLHYVRSERGLRGKQAIRQFCQSRIWGFDIDARAVRVAKALMLLASDGSANLYRLNSLLRPDRRGQNGAVLRTTAKRGTFTIEEVCRDRLRRHKGFDVILTNPPFAGDVRERYLLDGYALSADKPRMERDILFVERCLQLLRPGGRMAIVLPHNKVAADSFDFLREWLFRKARILAVVGLGRNTFLPHTHQKASILFLQKSERPPAEDYNIFFAISERDGKNSKGQLVCRTASPDAPLWDRVDHDFGEIVQAFHQFCISEQIQLWR